MKRIRAVVEISVPEKVELSEDDFAKLLRRNMKTGLSLMPHEMATRHVTFKAFYRVVQYGPDGARIVPPTPAKPFEWLVLRALYFMLQAMRGPSDKARKWVDDWVSDARSLLEHEPEKPEELHNDCDDPWHTIPVGEGPDRCPTCGMKV